MSRVRLGECERKIIFMPSKVRLDIFWKKLKIRVLNIHYFALKLYTGASKLYSWTSKSGSQGVGPWGPPDPPSGKLPLPQIVTG